MTSFPPILAFDLTESFGEHTGVVVAAIVVLIGLVGIGFHDVARFSWTRVWAISTVCWQQAVRRRVLWLTPLIMLGVFVVSQLAHPDDAQDDVRLTVKFCLFATGLLLTILMILLASTNLPKEIENRVIYTVATKPVTRFEIVLGKVVGFARVSAAILIIMGLFSFGYLRLRDWQLRKVIAQRLETPDAVRGVSRQTQDYYRNAGLLHARNFAVPGPAGSKDKPAAAYDVQTGLQFYAALPQGDPWIAGGGDQEIWIGFPNFGPAMAGFGQDNTIRIGAATSPNDLRILVPVRARLSRRGPPQTQPVSLEKARVGISIRDQHGAMVVTWEQTGPLEGIPLTGNRTEVFVAPKALAQLNNPKMERVYIQVSGLAPGFDYSVDPAGVEVIIPPMTIDGRQQSALSVRGFPEAPLFRGRIGNEGQQLRGEPAAGGDHRGPIAIYCFKDVNVSPDADGQCTFEFKAGIERSGAGDEEDREVDTKVLLEVYKGDSIFQRPTLLSQTPVPDAQVRLTPETGRAMYFKVPAAALEGGNFNVVIRCQTPGHWVGLRIGNNASLRAVTADESFAINLAKSMLVMWLMSVLVVSIAIFCSTFVSWPIAVILTSVILMSHWVVIQLGDFGGGQSRMIVSDIFGKHMGAAQTTTLTKAVDLLTGLQTQVSRVLPDISQYASAEHIEQGAAVPMSVLWASLKVTLLFGVPMIVLSYVILRFKEVAP